MIEYIEFPEAQRGAKILKQLPREVLSNVTDHKWVLTDKTMPPMYVLYVFSPKYLYFWA